MKHPSLDYEELYRILGEIPEDLPYFYVLYAYIVVALRRCGGCRERTALRYKIARRTLTDQIHRMKAYGFDPPPPYFRKKKHSV